MTEKEINIKYIRSRLRRVVPDYMLEEKMLYEVLQMLKEVYIEGLREKNKENILQNCQKSRIIRL